MPQDEKWIAKAQQDVLNAQLEKAQALAAESEREAWRLLTKNKIGPADLEGRDQDV